MKVLILLNNPVGNLHHYKHRWSSVMLTKASFWESLVNTACTSFYPNWYRMCPCPEPTAWHMSWDFSKLSEQKWNRTPGMVEDSSKGVTTMVTLSHLIWLFVFLLWCILFCSIELTYWSECLFFLDPTTGIQVAMLTLAHILKPVYIKVQRSKALIFELTEIQNASVK